MLIYFSSTLVLQLTFFILDTANVGKSSFEFSFVLRTVVEWGHWISRHSSFRASLVDFVCDLVQSQHRYDSY
jgi:hypothetical protein